MEEAVSVKFTFVNMRRFARAMKWKGDCKQSELKNEVISNYSFSKGCISGGIVAD